MKRTLVLLLTLSAALLSQAAKVNVVVMDTAQSLIYQAQVKNMATAKTYTTSVDGMAVVDIRAKQQLCINATGYKQKKLRWNGKDTLFIVRMVPVRKKSEKKTSIKAYGRSKATTDGELYYSVESAPVVMAYESGRGSAKVTGAKANSISAGKLTAGEVNDFAQWYSWSRLLDNTHRAYIKDWKLALRQRYTVQVTNAQGFPIASCPVDLLDGQGNTLFQAMTDNTGKAELWAWSEQGEQIAVNGQKAPAKLWDEGVNSFVIDEPCQPSETADVLFVVDATGSMGDEIDYLQAEMKDVIARSQGAVEGLTIRTGAVFYCDYNDDYLTRISRLTGDINTTQRFIDRQSAGGGGDYPEAVPEALKAALNVGGWDEQARARIIFLVLDAPCHKDSATVALLHEQIRNAAAMGVRIVPVVCSGLDKSGELLMREIALATNGTSFFLTDDSGIGNKHLKPTTDSLKVEHLNEMMVRTIVNYCQMPRCEAAPSETDRELTDAESFLPNPFHAEELEYNTTLQHGETTLYVIDVTGKVLGRMTSKMEDVTPEQLVNRFGLPTGVYFLKAFYNGEWHTRKVAIYRF